MSEIDPRRRIPRTDLLLELPEAIAARSRWGETFVRSVVTDAQEQARRGELHPDEIRSVVQESLSSRRTTSLTSVINATGIVVHTNLGRAPLSQDAVEAVVAASGYVDVEVDLGSGLRSKRGVAAREALLHRCPTAEDALIVNNGAAALVLATTALAAGREVVISRGELVEIGAGFRLPDLIASTGVRLREVGTTNRTHLNDYLDAIGPETGCVLKVHPSNFRVEGFTSEVSLAELRPHADVPLIADIGSGLLEPDAAMPDEPDATTALKAGADLVISSGDKLLGGPQAGLLLGRRELVQRLGRHPLARAVRVDKLTLAALEATLNGAVPPVVSAIHADTDDLRRRTDTLARGLGVDVISHEGRVGGGGAPGLPLPGWALVLPEAAAGALRASRPAVLAHTRGGACLVDLRCVPESQDPLVVRVIRDVLARLEDA